MTGSCYASSFPATPSVGLAKVLRKNVRGRLILTEHGITNPHHHLLLVTVDMTTPQKHSQSPTRQAVSTSYAVNRILVNDALLLVVTKFTRLG